MAGEYRRLILVYGLLLLLLTITVGSSLLDLGALNPVINIGIAVAKAGLIFWFFMELREASGLVRLFAAAAMFWLFILFFLGIGDWLSR